MNIERQELQRRIASQRITRPSQLLPHHNDTFKRELRAARYLERVSQLCLCLMAVAFALCLYYTLSSAYKTGGWYGERYQAPATVNHVI